MKCSLRRCNNDAELVWTAKPEKRHIFKPDTAFGEWPRCAQHAPDVDVYRHTFVCVYEAR